MGSIQVPMGKKSVLRYRPSKFFVPFAFIISLRWPYIENLYIPSKSTGLYLSNATGCTKFWQLVFEYYIKTFYPCPVIHRMRVKNRGVLGEINTYTLFIVLIRKKESLAYFSKYIFLSIGNTYVYIRLSN